eukprot:CAMPEP_0169082254 /NCGR_PEP_ID=MMETSP1015-20121227/11447_1 /TAXON_ID=342587 /ORGANISM="Karlodinium micrum, Strain CCMP2283" /LENGTH=235 /DNA_ID=CAMNT_0009142099 /DNA_START=116 /DNA_END=824 /DNA_ORIENTATION=+
MNSSSSTAQNGSEVQPGTTASGTGSKSKVSSRSSGRRQGEGDEESAEQSSRQANGYVGATNSASNSAVSTDLARRSTGDPTAGPSTVPMNNYAFFVKYTYSNECALLAYNFHEMVTQLGLFEYFTYRHDHRLISVTLAYIFYRYQVHHCDMALDLAVTLVYLEDVRQVYTPELHENNKDAFNLICYLAFLAHAFSADRTIRLSDWYKEKGGAHSGIVNSSTAMYSSSSARCEDFA